jgi:hypothetical protein
MEVGAILSSTLEETGWALAVLLLFILLLWGEEQEEEFSSELRFNPVFPSEGVMLFLF